MTKLFVLLFASLTIGAVANAQPPGGGAGRGGMSPEAMIAQMKDSLNLSQVQVDSVTAIYKEFLPKQMELRQNQDMSREDRMAKMQEINADMNKRLKGALTEEQYKKFQEMQERRRQRMQGGGGGRGGN